MNLTEAVDAIREKLVQYRLTEGKTLWATILKQIAKQDAFDGQYADTILEAIRAFLKPLEDKTILSLWRETETGMCDNTDDDCLFPDCCRMDLEMELLQEITKLPGKRPRKAYNTPRLARLTQSPAQSRMQRRPFSTGGRGVSCFADNLEPAADQLADLVNGLGRKAVALDLEALQVLGEPHLEAEDFQNEVGLLQQFLALPGVLGPDQDFQQVVEVPFDAFAQHEAVVAGEFAGVIARPQDQVIRLRDDDQFFMCF